MLDKIYKGLKAKGYNVHKVLIKKEDALQLTLSKLLYQLKLSDNYITVKFEVPDVDIFSVGDIRLKDLDTHIYKIYGERSYPIKPDYHKVEQLLNDVVSIIKPSSVKMIEEFGKISAVLDVLYLAYHAGGGGNFHKEAKSFFNEIKKLLKKLGYIVVKDPGSFGCIRVYKKMIQNSYYTLNARLDDVIGISDAFHNRLPDATSIKRESSGDIKVMGKTEDKGWLKELLGAIKKPSSVKFIEEMGKEGKDQNAFLVHVRDMLKKKAYPVTDAMGGVLVITLPLPYERYFKTIYIIQNKGGLELSWHMAHGEIAIIKSEEIILLEDISKYTDSMKKVLNTLFKDLQDILKPSSVKMIEEFGKESNKEIIPPYMEEAIKKYNDQKKREKEAALNDDAPKISDITKEKLVKKLYEELNKYFEVPEKLSLDWTGEYYFKVKDTDELRIFVTNEELMVDIYTLYITPKVLNINLNTLEVKNNIKTLNRDYDLSHLQLEFLENACKILTRVTKNVLRPSSVKMIEEFGKDGSVLTAKVFKELSEITKILKKQLVR